MLHARITDIQHFNVHDGPGFRTIVFFQGCTLACKWCQNPETISTEPRILLNPDLCIGCGACIRACPTGAISVSDARMYTDDSKCTHCGTCEAECYPLARKLTSRIRTLDEVLKEVMKEERAYRISGGGITVSGGEPLLHAEFVQALLSAVKKEGINTAIETAGNVPADTFERVLPCTDTFLFDFKLFDPESHRAWTGCNNRRILDNMRAVTDRHDNVVIRVPLIPGVNDTDEEFGAMMDYAASLRTINSIHILPFHNLGANKYNLLNETYSMLDTPEDNDVRVDACSAIAEAHGFPVSVGGAGFVNDKKRMMQQSFII